MFSLQNSQGLAILQGTVEVCALSLLCLLASCPKQVIQPRLSPMGKEVDAFQSIVGKVGGWHCNHVAGGGYGVLLQRGGKDLGTIFPFVTIEGPHTNSMSCAEIRILFFFFFLATLLSLCDLGSPTRDRTCAPCSGSVES